MSTHVAIIGNGVAGITAARFIRKRSDARLTVISDETDYFYARTALMYVYMGHMRFEDVKPYEDGFWEKNRIDLVRDYVTGIDVDRKRLVLRDGDPLGYDILLIATGSRPRRLGVPGETLDGVQGLYGIPDLEAMERATESVERAVVVGGGLIGIEMAEMLRSRHLPVTFLVREASFLDHVLPPEESAMVNREIRRHDVDLRLGTEVAAFDGDAAGRVAGVVTTSGERIPCQFAGVTVGVAPNVDVVRDSPIEANRGVLVNDRFETNVPNVYAVGDCREFRRDGIGHTRIDQLWYTARREGKALARIVCGDRTPYDRGVFFNSAKFFTIEYQTYGHVRPMPGDEEQSLCWHQPEENRLVRINYRTEEGSVVGINVMGIRYRHAVCERWIREGYSIETVLSRLDEANFDPEFSPRFERALVDQYRSQRPSSAFA